MYNAYNTENTDKMRKSTTKKGSEPVREGINSPPNILTLVRRGGIK